MSLLKKIFSNNSERAGISTESKINWVKLESITQIDTIKKNSDNNTAIIFKHSTRCGISRMVLKSFEKKWAESTDINFYILDLIRFREMSNTIAQEFEIVHQSPQLIVLEKGKVRTHASHYDILNIAI
ncbi:MAG: bacillithiol system redox-active protein YtxJ [Flavobacteriaceae bacterium]